MVRFDTRETKPRLRALAALSVAAVVIELLLAATGAQEHALAICLVFCAYLLAAFVCLAVAFVEQLRFNPYSYNTVYYSGFAIFVLVQLAMGLNTFYNLLQMGQIQGTVDLASILASSAFFFVVLSGPFILLFSVGMCISNISLIRHEGLRPTNLLAIGLSFFLIGSWVFLFVNNQYASGSAEEVRNHDLVFNTLSVLYLYLECMLIGTIVASAITARYEPDRDKDFLIVLGSGLMADGTPTPLLAGRIERALGFWKRQLEETGKRGVFVCSGGQGPDEAVSEAESMARYLLERGVDGDCIIREDRSTSTLENMEFSKALIEERAGEDALASGEAKVAFSTTNYHVFRSGIWARRVSLRAQGMGARTKWYFWPNAAVREFAGLLTAHRGKQAMIIGAMLVASTLLTFIVYR